MSGVIEWFASLTFWEKVALPLGAAFFLWLGKKVGQGAKMIFLKETNEKISAMKDEISSVKSKQDLIVEKMESHTQQSERGFDRVEKTIDKLEGVLIQHLSKKE